MKTILIIGGGLGGLFTGALFTKEGYRVTVLEKNVTIGGGLQCFKRHGVSFETGMHVLGGFQEGGNLNLICRYLGIMDKLHIRPTDQNAMDSIQYGDGSYYELPQGKEAFGSYLAEKFPAEADNIRRYMDALFALSEEVDLFHLRKGVNTIFTHSEQFLMPADEFIAYYIKDQRLRDLLAYMNPMYGGVAGHTPAFIHAMINVLYIMGSSQFEGGSQQMADLLAEIICDGGGAVHAADPVEKIEVVDRMVQRVITKHGKEYTADWYISAIHPTSLFKLTGPEAFPKSYRTRLGEIPNSYSAFSVFIKFKPETQPYVNHPRYYQQSYGSVWNLAGDTEENFPQGFMYTTPPRRDQDEWAERMVVNCIMSFDKVRQWEDTTVGHRGADYEAWKERHMQRVIDRLEQIHPGFRETIEFCFASSPLTIRDYYNVKEGALYGYRCDCKDITFSQVSIGTKVRNLLFTGQNINLHGICGVPLTAIETVEAFTGPGTLVEKINPPTDK